MIWFRVDNRLIHGQIIEAWIPWTGARLLLVFNDALAADELQQMVVGMAVPSRIRVELLPVAASPVRCRAIEEEGEDAMALFGDCPDARRAMELGLAMSTINLGNLHFSQGKRQVCPHISLSNYDQTCLQYFREHDVDLDFRCVPGVPVILQEWT